MVGNRPSRLRPDVRTVIDPYSGEELVAFPAIHPDVAVIHALVADPDGNALIGDNKGVDAELCLCSSKVIITTEELVPELKKADLAAPCVEAVVLAPRVLYYLLPSLTHSIPGNHEYRAVWISSLTYIYQKSLNNTNQFMIRF
jgi:hypothetical protein